MRTNIVLDDALVAESFKYANVTTKRELVNLALREFVRNHRKKDIRALLGKVKIDENPVAILRRTFQKCCQTPHKFS